MVRENNGFLGVLGIQIEKRRPEGRLSRHNNAYFSSSTIFAARPM